MRALLEQPTRVAETHAEEVIPQRTATANAVPLGALERRVADAVDGRSTLGEISLRLGLSVVELSHVLHRLAELAVVEVAGIDLDEGWDRASGTSPTARPTIPPVTKRANE